MATKLNEIDHIHRRLSSRAAAESPGGNELENSSSKRDYVAAKLDSQSLSFIACLRQILESHRMRN